MKKKNPVEKTSNTRLPLGALTYFSHVENIFLAISFTFGLLFLLITPPFQVPDEPAHFYRSYQISQGDVFPQKEGGRVGGVIPNSLSDAVEPFTYLFFKNQNKVTTEKILEIRRIPLNQNKTTFTSFQNTALYSPIAYAPQVLGILAGRIFNLGPLDLMYLSRFFSLAVWIALMYIAIKNIPVGKWALFTVSLMPMLIFLIPAVSADSFIFGLTALATSYAIKYSHSDRKLTRKDLIFIFFISAVISLVKLPYSLAFLIFLFIPAANFKNSKEYFFFWVTLLTVCSALLGAWYLAMQGFYVPGRLDIIVSPQQQLGFLKQNPVVFFQAIYDTYLGNIETSGFIFSSFTGTLGWLDTTLPMWLSVLVFINITLGFLSIEQLKMKINLFCRLVAVLLPIAMFMAINLLIYLSWTAIGSGAIEGIQGRYYLPLVLLIIPAMATRKNFLMKIDSHRSTFYMIVLQLIILSSALFSLMDRFYL